MPEFRRNAPGAPAAGKRITSVQVMEPRCKVCSSKFRKAIDRQLALGTSYSELERLYEIDRRSFSNHDKKHLNVEEAAIRELIRREAAAVQENIEEGVSSAVRRRVYLETAMQKALEGLMNGSILVDSRDAVAIIDKLDRMDSLAGEGAINEMRIQVNAFIKAIKEVVPKQYWDDIFKKSQEIIAKEQGGQIDVHVVMEDDEPKTLDSGDDVPDS